MTNLDTEQFIKLVVRAFSQAIDELEHGKEYGYPRLPDEEYNKIRWQLRASITGVLATVEGMGYKPLIPGMIDALTEIGEQAMMRVRGKKDQMIRPSDPRYWGDRDNPDD